MSSFQELRSTETATIALGESLSGAVELNGVVPVAILMPSAWTTANLTFQASPYGTTYGNLYSYAGASEYEVTAAASLWLTLDPEIFLGARFIKIRSGTSGTPVVQAAARDITVVVRPI